MAFPDDGAAEILFKNNPRPLWIYDLGSLAFLEVNDAALDMLGYSRAELQGMTIKDILLPEDVNRLLADLAQARPALQHSGEWRHLLKDGRVLDVNVTSHVLKFNGRDAVLVTAEDITDRKRAEESLRSVEADYRALFEGVPVAVFQSTPQGRYRQINPAMARIYGYDSPQEMLASITDIDKQIYVNSADRQEFQRILAEHGEVLEFNAQNYRRDRTIVWVQTTARAVKDAQGRILWYEGISSDITESKRAEEALRASEAKLRAVVENSNDGILFTDADATLLYRSPSYDRINGFANRERLGHSGFETVHPDDLQEVRHYWARLLQDPELSERIEYRIRHKDGSWRWIETSCINLLNNPDVGSIVVTSRDITEHRQAEERLRASEAQFRSLFENAPIGIGLTDLEGRVLALNDAMLEMSGYTRADLDQIGNAASLYYDPKQREEAVALFMKQGLLKNYEIKLKRRDGTFFYALLSLTHASFNGKPCIQASVQNINERKQAEDARQRAEQSYRTIFNESIVGMFQSTREGRFLIANPALAQMWGYDSPEELISSIKDIASQVYVDGRERDRFVRRMDEIDHVYAFEYEVRRKDKKTIWVSESARAVRDARGILLYYEGQIEDITLRRQAEVRLRTSEAQFRDLFNHLPIPAFTKDTHGIYTSCNEENLKYWATNPVGHTDAELLPNETAAVLQRNDQLVIKNGTAISSEEFLTRTPLGDCQVITHKVPLRDGSGNIIGILGASLDITERKKAEGTLEQRVRELQALYEISAEANSQETLDTLLASIVKRAASLLNSHSGGLYLMEPDGASLRLVIGHNLAAEYIGGTLRVGEDLSGMVAQSGELLAVPDYQSWSGRAEAYHDAPFRRVLGVPLKVQGRLIGVINVSDLARTGPFSDDEIRLVRLFADQAALAIENKRLSERAERRLQRTEALHRIDTAIAGSIDIGVIFDVILENAMPQLRADAADILLYNGAAQVLEYAAGHGFRTKALQHTHLPMGEGYAGRAALGRELVHISELPARRTDFLRSPTFSQEGFVSYYGTPLIAKGELKGVLEIFHRSVFEADTEWLNFLNALAGQAAITIDNATLFKHLQLSNVELNTAYDATIEGWSRAMDLRDKETEGHTERVTEMTERLARRMGIEDAELVHFRRGALLHDIGKMGVPDHVLLKPGKLTDEEWQIMKKHPQFAHDMLSPIPYLKPALDIPYCHHEKWDGSGYPQGLKGEGIPLAARIFAVGDVWDALTSDRPYRKAWSKGEAMQYIREQSGRHFDPRVVQVFVNEFGNG
ncbi:MAG TPA: PAS domain S-box protein [Anaerolineales bacterium]|nr:PAS domain S-box protein [Anaerolineales bacterium]